jgi:uncharacterized protein (UPF0212 family)
MGTLSAATLLDIWERGWGQSSAQQALLLLTATEPNTSLEQMAALSIGQRDARLLHLREHLFGATMAGVTDCPHCNERIELNFNATDIGVAPMLTAPVSVVPATLMVDGYTLTVRPLNSFDLLTLSQCADAITAEQVLLKRCVSATDAAGVVQAVEPLPSSVQDAAIEQLAKIDPQADTQFDLTCPACGHDWQAEFDIVAFLWSEINTWADRVLREVHQLAVAYGWREADILAMSPTRRQLYLELVGR